MKELSFYIKELLFQYDCVVIPQFGGLIGNYFPASIKEIHQQIDPPFKKITFNRQIQQNDGLLAHYIANKEAITFEKASAFIESCVNEMLEDLKNYGRFSLNDIGTFSTDKFGNILFEPYNQNYLIESFGLSAASALLIKKDAEFIAPIKVKDRTIRPEKEKLLERRKPITRQLIRAAVLIPVIAACIWLPLKTTLFENGKLTLKSNSLPRYQNFASVIPVFDSNSFKPLEEPVQNNKNYLVKLKLSEHSNRVVTVITTKTETLPDATEVKTSDTPVLTSSNRDGKYHIIGGCFEVMDNALRYAQELRNSGFTTAILDKRLGKLNPVSYGSFKTREEALKLLQKVRVSNPDAWLLIQ